MSSLLRQIDDDGDDDTDNDESDPRTYQLVPCCNFLRDLDNEEENK